MDIILLVANLLFVTVIFGGLLVLTYVEFSCGFLVLPRVIWRFYFIFYMCFLIMYYLFHILAKKYAERIRLLSNLFFCIEMPAFLFVGCYVFYVFNVFILEGIAYLTNNFWGGISARGHGNIVFFGALLYVPYLIFVILDVILFTPIFYRIKRAMPVANVGYSSLYFSVFRAFCYLCLGICSLIAVHFWLSQIKM